MIHHVSGPRWLVALTLLGWIVAGFLCAALVSRVGWLGIAIIGAAVLLVALRWEIDDENALPVPYGSAGIELYVRQYERNAGLRPEEKLARAAERSSFARFLYAVRTAGIALAVLGLAMFSYHQVG